MPSGIAYPTTDPLPDIVDRLEENYLEYPGVLHAWGAEEIKNATRAIASKIFLKDFVAMTAMWEYEVIITYYYDACRLWNDKEATLLLAQQMCCLIDGGGRWIARYLELRKASRDPESPAFHPDKPQELGAFLLIAQKYDKRNHSTIDDPSGSIESALRILRRHYLPKRLKQAESQQSTPRSSVSRPISPRPQIEVARLPKGVYDWYDIYDE